jgi:hypothetical protein
MFNSNCQQKIPNPMLNADRCVGVFLNLQPGLAMEEIGMQGEALAAYSVEELSQFCARLIVCASRQGASKPC